MKQAEQDNVIERSALAAFINTMGGEGLKANYVAEHFVPACEQGLEEEGHDASIKGPQGRFRLSFAIKHAQKVASEMDLGILSTPSSIGAAEEQ